MYEGVDILIDIETVYRAYFHDVYRYLLKLTSDKHLAEELTAETFMKVIEYKGSFESKSHIKTWIIKIAKNNFLNYLKKNKRVVVREQLDDSRFIESFENSIVQNEDVNNILKVLDKIKEPHKEVFKLRVIDELSFRDIGRIFGKSENWACVTFYRSKERIRKEVNILNG